MSNQRIFRSSVVQQVYNSAIRLPAGIVLELDLPAENTLRTMWCYYENYDITNAPIEGDAAWIIFSRNGESVVEFPAVLRLNASSRLGVANYAFQGQSAYSYGRGIQNTLFFDNLDATGIQYCVQAFNFEAEVDHVRIESNRAGNTQCLLSVLSLPKKN